MSNLPLSKRIHKYTPQTEPIICPNCGQPFDANWSATHNTETVRVNGSRSVTCPRCRETFEA